MPRVMPRDFAVGVINMSFSSFSSVFKNVVSWRCSGGWGGIVSLLFSVP